MSSSTVSGRPQNAGTTILLLLGASVLALVLSAVPFAGLVTYPLRLFSTFIHETGHILATLGSFGSVDHMVVNWDSSGVTYTRGGSRFLIGSAGYLGTTLYGALMLLASRKTSLSRWALGLSAATILAVTSIYAGEGSSIAVLVGAALGGTLIAAAVWAKIPTWTRVLLAVSGLFAFGGTTSYLFVSNGFLTWMLGLGGVALLGLSARYTGGDVVRFVCAFLGIQVSLDAVFDIFTLVGLSSLPSVHTDAHNMSRDFFFPAIVWAVGWSGLSMLLVFGVLGFIVWEWRRETVKAT